MGSPLKVDEAPAVSAIAGIAVLLQSRHIVTQSGAGQLAIWNADGTLRQVVGREGAGPGEYRSGRLSLHQGQRGLAVFDPGLLRWTFYDTTFRVAETVTAQEGGGSQSFAAILRDGAIVDGDRPGPLSASLSLRSTAGSRARVVAELTAGELPAVMTGSDRQRLIAYGGGESFVAGPPRATGRGYEIQVYGIDGRLRTTFRRPASWFPAGSDRRERPGGIGPGSEIEILHDLGDDLILVGIRTPNANWASAARDFESGKTKFGRTPDAPLPMEKAIDAYIEVLDLRSGALLVSEGPMTISKAMAMLPAGWFHGTKFGYKELETPSGLTTLQKVTYALSAR